MAQARILVVAPYPEMVPELKAVAEEFPDTDFSIETGDIESGLESALSVFHLNFDVVVSRGGTAQLLEDELSLPVIEIELTIPELLRMLREVPEGVDAVALVGFRNVLRNARELDPFFPFDIDIYGVDFEDEMPGALADIARNDYEVVLCDVRSYTIACDMGLPAHLLVSGKSGIRDAFERAVAVCEQQASLAAGNQLLRDILQASDVTFVAFGNDRRIVFSNLAAHDRAILPDLQARMTSAPPKRFVIQREGLLYTITTNPLSGGDGTVFAITSVITPNESRITGIQYKNADDIRTEMQADPLHAIQAELVLEALAQPAAAQPKPVLVTGTKGGAELFCAKLIYLLSEQASRPLAIVDCSLLTERSWDFLMNSHRSPLYGSNATLLFRKIDSLDAHWRTQLAATINQTQLAKRYRVIFTDSASADGLSAQELPAFVEAAGCSTLMVPPVRTWSVLPFAAPRYLTFLAGNTGREAPVIAPQANDLLLEQGWEGDVTEFFWVVKWLFAANTSGIITTNDVADGLSNMRRYSEKATPSEGGTQLDLDRPLAEINRDIARAVLAQHDGNKSRAAKSLGISRTTLYGLLQ